MTLRIRGRRWATLALMLALAMIAAACSGGGGGEGEGGGEAATSESADAGGSEGGEAAQGGEFSVYIGEPELLSPPSNVTESNGGEVINALYAPLVGIDFESSEALYGEDAPAAVAESIETEDNQTFTITLKEGWTFHNGEPVNAQSYVDAWNYGAYGPNANNGAYFFANIAGYEDLQCTDDNPDDDDDCPTPPASEEMSGLTVVDEQTFTVELTEPFSIFPITLQYSSFNPLPAAFFDDPEAYAEEPIGNGPYQMAEPWARGQYIRVERFEDYAGEPAPSADAVEFRIYEEIDTAYNDLLAGNLDVMDQVPSAQIDAAEAEFGENFLRQPSATIQFLGFPTYDPRFSNPDLRRAFSLAIDRASIAQAVRPDFAPLGGFVPEITPGALDNECDGNCPAEANPEEARAALEAAGGWEGPLVLWFNSGADHDAWIEAVGNQIRDNLGIQDITFEQLQFAEYLPLLEGQQITGPYRLGWIPDYPSPHTYLDSLYSTGASSNYTGYANPEFDAAIAEGEAADSPEASVESFQEAESILNADMPAIPMFSAENTGAWSERVSGVEIDFFDELNIAEIQVTE